MNGAKDPRCPVCGNAVLAGGIDGNEGTYHLACTQPPVRIDWPPPPIVVEPFRIGWPTSPQPYDPWTFPQTICTSGPAEVTR